MGNSSAGLVSRVLAVYSKDLRIELRSRHAFNAILMFGVATLAVVSYSLGNAGLTPKLLAAIFWIVMFFSAMTGLALVFVREEESGTALALRLKAEPDSLYVGKLLFNLTLLVLMTAVLTPVFFVFTDAPAGSLIPFLPVLILGVTGLCTGTTLVAAIIARASIRSALFGVLSFPILVPLLLGLVSGSAKIMAGQPIGTITAELQFLVAYSVVMTTASVLLFRFVWQD